MAGLFAYLQSTNFKNNKQKQCNSDDRAADCDQDDPGSNQTISRSNEAML